MRQRKRSGLNVGSFLWECIPLLVLYSPLVNCLWLEGVWRVMAGIPSKCGWDHYSNTDGFSDNTTL